MFLGEKRIRFFMNKLRITKGIISVVFSVLFLSCTKGSSHLSMQTMLKQARNDHAVQDTFQQDSLMNILTAYFDKHGTANEKLLSHYLLGRCYACRNKVPEAMACYMKAISSADTTRSDCDYAQLARVCIQTAMLFHYQNLMAERLHYIDMSVYYALKAGDTICALTSLEQKADVYARRNMIDSVIFFSEYVAALYQKHGYLVNSAIALGCCVEELVGKKDYKRAKSYMDLYMSKSGRFETNGNIKKGYESYYHTIGTYYLAVNKLDSAEFYFRKELDHGQGFYNQNAAAKGLALVYQQKHLPDSTAKYALYSYDMNDSAYAHMATNEAKQIESSYNYSRYQEQAMKEQQHAEQMKYRLIISMAMIVVLVLLLYVVINTFKNHQEQLLNQQKEAYLTLTNTRVELNELRLHQQENESLILQKERIIAERENEINQYKKVDMQKAAIRLLHDTKACKELLKLAIVGKQPCEMQWQALLQQINHLLPNFSQFMLSHQADLTPVKYHICLLTRLSINPSMIASMLDVSGAYVSKARKEMLRDLFGKEGSSKEFDLEIRKMF